MGSVTVMRRASGASQKRTPSRTLQVDGERIAGILRRRMGDEWYDQLGPWRVAGTHRTDLLTDDLAFALGALTGGPILRRRNSADDGWVAPTGGIRWGVRPIAGPVSMN